MHHSEIHDSIQAFILGREVNRRKLPLSWEGRSIKATFIEQLENMEYVLTRVLDISVEIGYRAPAFLIRKQDAWFGYIKWMQYDRGIYHKYFGSVERKQSGSPLIIIRKDDPEVLYVSRTIREEIDMEGPPLYE